MEDYTTEEVLTQLQEIANWLETAGEDFFVATELCYQMIEEFNSVLDTIE